MWHQLIRNDRFGAVQMRRTNGLIMGKIHAVISFCKSKFLWHVSLFDCSGKCVRYGRTKPYHFSIQPPTYVHVQVSEKYFPHFAYPAALCMHMWANPFPTAHYKYRWIIITSNNINAVSNQPIIALLPPENDSQIKNYRHKTFSSACVCVCAAPYQTLDNW